MKRLILVSALACATPASGGGCADARLTVVNDTSSPMNQLFVSGGRSGGLRAKVAGIVGPADDDRDRLDAKMLPRGGSIALTLKGARCRYDIRAVLEDGRSYIADDIDICASPRWAVSEGTRR